MKAPGNTKIYEGELATFWFDENGILCAVAKKTNRTLQKQKENYKFIKQITENKKVCLLSETTTANPPDKATREYMEKELPNYFKAMAVLSKSVLGEIIPKLFMTVNKQTIPIKYFTSVEEAKQWLKQYL